MLRIFETNATHEIYDPFNFNFGFDAFRKFLSKGAKQIYYFQIGSESDEYGENDMGLHAKKLFI